MKGYWNDFIAGFCKVEIVCWEGGPNWLGWIILAIVALMILGLVLKIFGVE